MQLSREKHIEWWGDTRHICLASQIIRINAGDQWGEGREHRQILLQPHPPQSKNKPISFDFWFPKWIFKLHLRMGCMKNIDLKYLYF